MQNTFVRSGICNHLKFFPVTLTKLQYRTYYGPRPADVPTHRGEVHPFTCNNLWDNPQAIKKKKRLGRGNSSGKGKTAGQGHKGQGQRGTARAVGFEGGQTPLQKRLPKYGRRATNQTPLDTITISRLLYFVNKGWLDKTKTITIKDIWELHSIGSCKYGLKVLGNGASLQDFPLKVEASDITPAAFEAIKENGGHVKLVHRDKLFMNIHQKPQNWPVVPLEPFANRKTVKIMERKRAMGVEVEYKMPEWAVEDLENKETIDEIKKQKETFAYPFPRTPGIGAERIRKRKEIIPKKIDLKVREGEL